MPDRDEILSYLDDLLGATAFNDHCPNGLQVPGTAKVTKVVTGVTGQLELFERAAQIGAQLVIVHHGIFWDFHPRYLSEIQAGRLRVFLESNITLAAYHLPLDAHPEIGNNALIVDGLGCVSREPFGDHHGDKIGFAGRFSGEGIAIAELISRVKKLTGREPLLLGAGPERVASIGIVSGGAANDLSEAIDGGLDAFLTGEPAEHVMAQAREAKVHFIAAGHYATETFGVQRLGELLAERFGIEHTFIDIPNPV
ncbi:MAG: Nif3-like dinuclear metal center hexameric protein [Solirubrobacterales bacterium]|nr:Nif3-like dinuclear metal center hexameric protein [Solirubrobacterales bacterium]